jgi:hypothetical protein
MKFLAIVLAAFVSSSAFADNEGEKMMSSPALYNGTRSVQSEFLPMGWLGMCTATAVAKDVIYTAAHCVSNGQRVKFSSRFDGKAYYAICSKHPRYNDRTVYNDWALCKLEAGATFPEEMPLASFLEKTPEVGQKLLLNGYGAPTVGTHHWGPATFDRVNGQDLVICDRVVLGGGDSGGSLLEWSEDRSGKSGFKIVGVNSRAGGGCSYFNRISHEEFGSFARDYEKQRGVKLCGISAVCTGSTPPPPPPPPPQPTNCWQVYEEFAFCLGTKSIPGCLLKADLLKQCVR